MIVKGESKRRFLASFLLVFLSSGSFSQRTLLDYQGDSVRTQGMRAFSRLTDLNGDGIQDFIHGVGASLHYVRSGADPQVIISWYHGPGPNHISSGYGGATAVLADWDGDGIQDYAVGAPGHSEIAYHEGLVRVFSGATHQVVAEITRHQADHSLGGLMWPVGDINGDGLEELAILGGSGYMPGNLYIYSGPQSGGTLLRTHVAEYPGAGTRRAVRFTDLNGDGKDDYLLGRPFDGTGGVNAGGIDVISGEDGSVLVTGYGQRPQEKIGRSMSRAGDWNGDGLEDFVGGSWGTTYSLDPAYTGVYVYSGLDGSVLRFFDGLDYSGYQSSFGTAVASGRDLTGDGIPDLVVGAPTDANEGFEDFQNYWRGAAFVFSGNTGALIWKLRGPLPTHRYGFQVDAVPDHDGDGIDDWVMLTPDYNTGPPSYLDIGRLLFLAGAPAEAETLCPAAPNSTGNPARLWNSGPIALGTNALVLVAEDLPPGAPGILAFGADTAPTPFGSGDLCLSTGLVFLSAHAADATGLAQMPVDLQSPAIQTWNSGLLRPGDVGTFQFLYRDGTTRNSTPALRVTFPE